VYAALRIPLCNFQLPRCCSYTAAAMQATSDSRLGKYDPPKCFCDRNRSRICDMQEDRSRTVRVSLP